jgi:hypothetical protein
VDDLHTLRDHAMVTSAYWGQLEGREVVDLDLDRLERCVDWWVFRDVGWRHRTVILDRCANPQYCAIATIERWLAASGITSGKVFLRIHYNGTLRGSGMGRGAASTALAKRLAAHPELPKVPFTALRAGNQERAFHAGVSYETMITRSGYVRQTQFEKRMRRVVRAVEGDRSIRADGQRATSEPRRRRRRSWRST